MQVDANFDFQRPEIQTHNSGKTKRRLMLITMIPTRDPHKKTKLKISRLAMNRNQQLEVNYLVVSRYQDLDNEDPHTNTKIRKT